MSIQEWGIIIGAIGGVGVLLVPWLFMVHAKLAVISTQIADMIVKVARLQEAEENRVPKCIQHSGRLSDLERRVTVLEK